MKKEIEQFFNGTKPNCLIKKYYPSSLPHENEPKKMGIGPFRVRTFASYTPPITKFALGCYTADSNLQQLAQTAEVSKITAEDRVNGYINFTQEQILPSSTPNDDLPLTLAIPVVVLFYMGIIDRATNNIMRYDAEKKPTVISYFREFFKQDFSQKIDAALALTEKEKKAFAVLKSLCTFELKEYENERKTIITNRLQLMKNNFDKPVISYTDISETTAKKVMLDSVMAGYQEDGFNPRLEIADQLTGDYIDTQALFTKKMNEDIEAKKIVGDVICSSD